MEPKAALRPFQDLHPVSLPIAESKQAWFEGAELKIQLDDGCKAIY
jgi:hypothetical protein